MADWVAISSLATAGGTLALAGTTYAAVRSGNRAARIAELSLLAQLRPLLTHSLRNNPPLRAGFVDGVGLTVPGEGAGVDVIDGRVYIAVSLRNVGPGIAVLHGGHVYPGRRMADEGYAELADFRRLQRDLYIPPAKIGFWQIAFRGETPERDAIAAGIAEGTFGVELLYGDYEGGQRVVSRFGVTREADGRWLLSVVRHWQVDRSDPR